jgi:hypothetical protein
VINEGGKKNKQVNKYIKEINRDLWRFMEIGGD